MTTEPTTRLSFEGTKRAMAEGAKYIPGGASSDYRIGEGALVLERGEGALLYDIDGNRLIDYFCGAGPIILGHNPPELVETMTRQLQKGVILGGETEDEYEAARLMTELVPVRRDGPLREHRLRGRRARAPDRARAPPVATPSSSSKATTTAGSTRCSSACRIARAASPGTRPARRPPGQDPAAVVSTPRSCPGTTSRRSRTGSRAATSPRSSPSRSGAATSRPRPAISPGCARSRSATTSS